METNLTRRGFLTGAATTGALAAFGALAGCAPAAPQAASNGSDLAQTGEAAAAGWSWETAPAPIADGDIVATVESDIVIVGAGLAGVTAACRATELGASVTVVEKMPFPSSRGGHYAAYQSRAMTEAGMTNDPKDEIVADWMRFSGNRTKEELAWLFMDRSSEVMDWLDDLSGDALNIIPIYTHYAGPQYYEHIGTHVIRGDFPDNENKISAPVYFMWKQAKSQGASFVFDTPAEQLVKEGDRVTAVIAKGADGYVKYVGTKAVVLATGDISGDPEMIEAYGDKLGLKPVVNAYTPEGANTGDGQKMGMWVGGRMQEYPVPTMIHLIRYCGLSFGFMYVNQEGRRFMNEDVRGGFACATIMHLPQTTAYCIWGQNRAAAGGPWGAINFVHGEYFTTQEVIDRWDNDTDGFNIVKADTREEVISQLGPPAETIDTIERYNGMCAAGADTDFYKTADKLIPIGEGDGPFYGAAFTPGFLTSLGGLRTDVHLRVLDATDTPIEGLYNAGCMIGNFYSATYTFAMEGMNYGACCITLPYVLGQELASGELA